MCFYAVMEVYTSNAQTALDRLAVVVEPVDKKGHVKTTNCIKKAETSDSVQT